MNQEVADRGTGSRASAPDPVWNPPAKDAPVAEWLAFVDDFAFAQWCGVRSTGIGDGFYECVLDDSPIALNPNEAVNGAVTAGVADHCVGAIAAWSTSPRGFGVTADLAAQFLRPALLPLTFRATLIGGGSTLLFVEVEAFDGLGRLCLHSSGTMAVRSTGTA